MIIRKQDKTNAEVVLELVKAFLDEDNNAEFSLEPYENGREHGYALVLQRVDGHWVCDSDLTRWIAFAEFRRSDSTVIYTDCGYWNGEITEKSYDEKQLYNFGKFVVAAQYIVEIMETAAEEVRNTWAARKQAAEV